LKRDCLQSWVSLAAGQYPSEVAICQFSEFERHLLVVKSKTVPCFMSKDNNEQGINEPKDVVTSDIGE
jgi:hypothetical protein